MTASPHTAGADVAHRAGTDRAVVRVGIDRALFAWAPEVRYVLRTLLRTAGLPYRLDWASAEGDESLDIYYGPRDRAAAVVIPAAMRAFGAAGAMEPTGLHERDGITVPLFAGDRPRAGRFAAEALTFPTDIVFASYWLLTGAREPSYRRDRWDNLHLDDTAFFRLGLAARPLVSQWAERLRTHFTRLGHQPAARPWVAGRRAAFAFSHDVDYPEIIRPIEMLRLLAARRTAGVRPALNVLRGRSHYWTFAEWVDFERELGARPTFYFMARRGSLVQYALGTPDDFYDVRSPRFRDLFVQLRDAGCEIGLHASYHAHRDAAMLRRERERIEQAAGVPVEGNRHHYWHLDPEAPHETLRRHEEAGLRYDSSLGLEMQPGYRRGICHPFRPYHPGERRELEVVQVPPAWMDDHFDRRLAHNRVADPDAYAAGLVDAARETEGAVVVDYHSRGMNAEIYPRYGPWLRRFTERHLDASITYRTPSEIASGYREYERSIERRSADHTDARATASIARPLPRVEIGPMRAEEADAVARMHHGFFAQGERNGHSIAKLGPDFLARVFYGLNLDNPYFFVDVARVDGAVVGFSAYASDGRAAFRHILRRHAGALARAAARLALSRPRALVSHVVGNLGLISDDVPPPIKDVRGWWLLLGVQAEYRTREFQARTGLRLADELWSYMEATLRAHGCDAVWAAPFEHNEPINRLFVNHGAELVARARVQGMPSNYYVKRIDMPERDA